MAVAGPIGLSSASGILTLLDEEQTDLRILALQRLNDVVDQFWAEIASDVSKIEQLYEDSSFSHSKLAALVASKVHYHLGSMDDALTYALRAGDLFDLSQKSEFVETIIAKAIDKYISLRVSAAEEGSAGSIPSALFDVVERMFDQCIKQGEYEKAIGIAIEARRIDTIEKVISASSDRASLLQYCFRVARDVVLNRHFRQDVLTLLVKLYRSMENADFLSIEQCLIFNDDAVAISELLLQLIRGSSDEALIAYQLGLELVENATQKLMASVLSAVGGEGGDAMETSDTSAKTETAAGGEFGERLARLRQILNKEISMELKMEFLFKNNKTDMQILKNVKGWIDARVSVAHSAVVFCNALLHTGTTVDKFLRDNFEWLGRATNWAKFAATASLGVIHKGHIKEAKNLLAAYLPGSAPQPSPYSEGGSLYALGLIHANHGTSITDYLVKSFEDSALAAQQAAATAQGGQGGAQDTPVQEIIQHGACLGLGLAAMATGKRSIVDMMVDGVLKQQSAISGEAAGYATGLIMLGNPDEELVATLLQLAHDSPHEKIIRGIAMSIALMNYEREESADSTIAQLSGDEDPLLRYGGMYAIAMAYCGTANNKAIRQLLHVAVSDVSDDVRRAAVIALGFVLFREPEQVPRMVALLAESYNPHVRYGAAIAVGIACASSGMSEAIELLETLSQDSVDFVRQGAFIALAMVLIQISEAQNSKVDKIRKLFDKVIQDKHEDLLAKFGAILAVGIIDGGGRNCNIVLHRNGHNNMPAIVGITMFLQNWYWFPMVHFASLAFSPTALIGLNSNLEMPQFQFKSNVRPALFAYPPAVLPPAPTTIKKATTAVLSVTARAAKRAAERKAKLGGTAMEGVESTTAPAPKEAEKKEEKTPEVKVEKDKRKFELLSNPARVTSQQQKYITFDVDTRYVPATSGITTGLVVLKDLHPELPQELIKVTVPASGSAAPEEQEPAPPEPFDYAD